MAQGGNCMRNDSNMIMKSAFEDAPVGILFMKDLKIIDINKIALEQIEYEDKSELIGKDPSVLSPEFQPNGKTSIRYAEEMFTKAMRDGFNSFEWVHITKSGYNKWFNVILKKLEEDPSILIAYWQEITKQKELETRFDNFMKHLPAAVYIKNNELEYKYINDYFKKVINREDITQGEFTSFTVHDILDKETADQVDKLDNVIKEQGGVSESLINYKFKDRDERTYRNIKFVFEDVDYEKYIGGVFLDVTDLIEANKRNQKLLESLITTIQSITEARDPYTSGHEERVSSLSVAIGRKLGLSDNQLEGLRIGAMIHDIGKVHIPLEILNKPGRLTPNQLSLVRDHSEVGYKLVESLKFDWPIKDMIKHHHEKFDGSGYPDNLKGEEILLEARIICVADVMEAMSSHRPYRPAKKFSEAINELKTNKGILYDPKVVEACCELIEKNEFKLKGWR